MTAISSLILPLSLALLTTPPGGPIDPRSADNVGALAALRPVVQALALHLEILDPRETRYVLTRDEDLAADLTLLRRRWHELHDAPRVAEATRFPDRTLISELLAFNRAYHTCLLNHQTLEIADWWQLREAVKENERLYHVWDLARDTRCDYYYVTVRRQALKKLLDTVGPEAFLSGTLPPHVPLWRFRRAD